MSERLESRVGEYRNQASKLRLLACQTRYLVSRHRLLVLAEETPGESAPPVRP